MENKIREAYEKFYKPYGIELVSIRLRKDDGRHRTASGLLIGPITYFYDTFFKKGSQEFVTSFTSDKNLEQEFKELLVHNNIKID